MKRFLLLLAVPLLHARVAMAAPFNFTPESFRHWLNAVKQTAWDSGDRVFFDKLANCSVDSYGNAYRCYNSYVTITDPRGSRVCLAKVQWEGNYSRSDGSISFGKGVRVTNISECRWLKDPRFVDR